MEGGLQVTETAEHEATINSAHNAPAEIVRGRAEWGDGQPIPSSADPLIPLGFFVLAFLGGVTLLLSVERAPLWCTATVLPRSLRRNPPSFRERQI